MIVSFDTNCLYALMRNEEPAADLRAICDLHRAGRLQVLVNSISLLENLREEADETEAHTRNTALLQALGIDGELAYPGFLLFRAPDGTLIADTALALQYHRALHDTLFIEGRTHPIDYALPDFARRMGVPDAPMEMFGQPQSKWEIPDRVLRKWHNANFDTNILYEHITRHGDVFVTLDDNFHHKFKRLQNRLHVPGTILRPDEARRFIYRELGSADPAPVS